MTDPTPTPSTPSAAAPAGDPNASATPPSNPNPAPAGATPPAASGVPPVAPAAGTGAPVDPSAVAPDWPADWREKHAKGDEKVLKRLQRYASPQAALDALFHAQNRITSGELKSALKPDATPEEKATWRAENGIPETPDKYDTTLKDGVVLSERDKPVVDEFLKLAHERNMRQEDVTEVLSWWGGEQMRQETERAARDHEARMETEVQLRQEFGPEFKRNMKIAADLLANAPDPEFGQRLMTARAADGKLLGDDPGFIRWLVSQARELNPVATVVPGASNPSQAIETELAGLRAKMGDRASDYWKGPMATKHQARYRELIAATQKGR